MVQHRAARFVLHDYSRLSHVPPMINQLEWDTLEQRRLLSQLTMFYKIQQDLKGIPLPPEVSLQTRHLGLQIVLLISIFRATVISTNVIFIQGLL